MSITFNKSVIGASHKLSEKPCQDFSMSYSDNNVTILVVCDGHGGNEYCRSDKGAYIAANVCKEELLKFADGTPAEFFLEKTFSITAKPQKNPFIDADGNRVRYEDLGESQQQSAKQAQAYINAESICIDQQRRIEQLLSDIYTEWRKSIVQDHKQRPFTDKELTAINGKDKEKAYGCTLLAFMQTKNYWLAFQIGDGKILICNKNLEWDMPVPGDCACFLNYTTSLCDNNPLIEFRYAFNGKETSPLAVMLCSDGLDGSLRSYDNLVHFYEQIIGLGINDDNIEIERELTTYLSRLSEIGNKDDISLSGMIDLSRTNPTKLQKIMNLNNDSRNIQIEHRKRKLEIETISSRLETLRMKLNKQKELRLTRQTELDEAKQKARKCEAAMDELDKIINTLRNKIEELEKVLDEKRSSFEDWEFISKKEIAEIEEKKDELTGQNITLNDEFNYTNW